MNSSGENSRKRKDDSDKSKRGEYRKFDQISSQMRETLIRQCAEQVIAHAAGNGGGSRRGFVKGLVDEYFRRAPSMEISRDDINNKVRIIRGQREEEEQREVSPAIPFHIIRDPSLSTSSDLSVSASSNEQNPLDILASQAVRTFGNTNQARDFDGMQLTLPNRCSYEGCGAPLHLVPEYCSHCLRLVHRTCQQFSVGQGITFSTLLCSVCCDGPGSGVTMPFAAAADVEEEEEGEEDDVEEEAGTRKKGGRPIGSTIENSRAQELARKQAANWVVVSYAALLEERKENCAKRLEYGTRKKLVERAITKFGIKGEFDVPKQTISNRIATERLEVWHRGTESPLLEVEVILTSFIYTAHRLCCPLDVGDVIALMNALISGTVHEKRLNKWKKAHCCYNADSPLVSNKWFRNYRIRNPELWLQKARKYARNREDHCNFVTFSKMYDQCEEGLVASGNVVRYDRPVHCNQVGTIVEDETLAFGHPVTIEYLRPENVFFLDETGDNTHGKDDGNRGGQRKVVPKGEIPKEIVGVRDSHFTITPITDATGKLRFVVVIFAAKEVSPEWSLGIDIFAEWDTES